MARAKQVRKIEPMIDTIQVIEKLTSLYGEDGVATEVITQIESSLNLQLPDDFKKIASVYSGGMIGVVPHHEIGIVKGTDNIVDETNRIRRICKLDEDVVVLAQPPDSIILMRCRYVRDYFNIAWIDQADIYSFNFSDTSEASCWATYSDFVWSAIME
jgi:hypothetical protein